MPTRLAAYTLSLEKTPTGRNFLYNVRMTTASDLKLIKAAAGGNLAEVNALLERGANPNAEDDVRNSALNEAAHAGHREVAQRLLEAGANVEHKGGADLTPLMNAAVTGHVDT